MKLNKKEWLNLLTKRDDEIQSKGESMVKVLGRDKYPVPHNFYIKYYYDKGIIRKTDLIDGALYFGLCRNAGIARWDAKESVFWYLRIKFNAKFFEKINHISDDDGYDLFLPIEIYKEAT